MRRDYAIARVGRRRALWAAALAVLLVPSGASAATLQRSGTTIIYTAAAGETNTVTFARSGGNYVVTDAPAVTITPAAPCAPVAANIATCPVTGSNSINACLLYTSDAADE